MFGVPEGVDVFRIHRVRSLSGRGVIAERIILLGGIGYAVDRWWGSAPWGLVIGLFLGVVVGFYEIIRVSLQPPAPPE